MSEDFALRPVTEADADAVARLHVASWQETYAEILPEEYLRGHLLEEVAERFRQGLRNGGITYLLATLNGEPVGRLVYGPCRDKGAEGEGEIYAIYLLERVQGSGHGRHMMERALAGLKAAGYTKAALWVFDANGKGRRFYEKAGFAPDGGRKTYELGGSVLPVVRYTRSL